MPISKGSLRRIMLARRRLSSAAARRRAARGLLAAALRVRCLRPSGYGARRSVVVGGYHAIGGELSPHLLLRAFAARRGGRVVHPDRSRSRGWTRLRTYACTAGGRRRAVPSMAPKILLVPVVAFSRRGKRLGRGKGYYDRWLAHWRRLPGRIAVGVGWEFQRQPDRHLPSDPWDQPLDYVLTEQGAYACRSGRALRRGRGRRPGTIISARTARRRGSPSPL